MPLQLLHACSTERVVDDVTPHTVHTTSGDISGGTPNVNLLAAWRDPGDHPIHDQQSNVACHVNVTRFHCDRQPECQHASIRLPSVHSSLGAVWTINENTVCFIDTFNHVRITGVEGCSKGKRLLARVGHQRNIIIGHKTNEPGGIVAHQTVSPWWDEELVPTTSGRTQAPSSECPVEIALSAISGRWTTLVLRNLLSGGGHSYSELAASLPQLSDKVLSDRLRALVTADLVERTVNAGFPQRTEYRITPRGEKLRPLLVELYRTGKALRASNERPAD